MVFSSTMFLFLFLPALLLLYYQPWITGRGWRNTILLIFSLLFYAWGEPLFVFLLLLSIVINWFCALQIEKKESDRKAAKLWLVLAITADLLLIITFKYSMFLLNNLAQLTGKTAPSIQISMPIGISFFTFQLMSYAFDVYYGNAAAQHNPALVALYVSLFPQLIAGPIVRYQQIESEIVERQESFDELSKGFRRFIYGLSKKVMLANYLAQIADNAFDYASSASVAAAWLGAIAYTLQIYFDFSGYSDMAVGLGLMFGFHFRENFNYPYIARSITDFWHRWHISLSTWFRDYVYIPLGGNRVSKQKWIRNLFIVWLLTGIWHGANWTFVLWGLLYFVVLLIEKETGIARKLGRFGHIYTMIIVILAWVFFRSADIMTGCAYIGRMFGYHATGLVDDYFFSTMKGCWPILLAALFGSTPLLMKAADSLKERKLGVIETGWLLLLLFLSLFEVVSSTYNPFIYFNF